LKAFVSDEIVLASLELLLDRPSEDSICERIHPSSIATRGAGPV
jgi:hypothetical protein